MTGQKRGGVIFKADTPCWICVSQDCLVIPVNFILSEKSELYIILTGWIYLAAFFVHYLFIEINLVFRKM